MGKQVRRWLGLVLVLCLFSLQGTAALQAQTTQPDPAAEEFRRGQQRTAPVRAPRTLSQMVATEGDTVGDTEGDTVGEQRTVLELPAIADTYIASARPNQNFGADSLFLGYNLFGDNYGAQRILIRFDIASNLPAGAVVNSARLRLRLAFASPDNDAPMGTVLRRLASAWSESTVTWNSEPQWTDVDDRTSVGTTQDWYEWNVGPEVQAWVDGTPNHGLELIGDERIQQRERAFYSRETATAFFPRLVVDYTVQTDREPPVVTVDPLPKFVGRNFTVAWRGSDPGGSGIAHYDVQYRIDGGAWVDWLRQVTVTSEEFTDGRNGLRHEFRARGVDNAGNVEEFGGPEAATTVDTQPPVSTVTPLPAIVGVNSFTVSWSGSDAGAGIQYYDVRFRANGGAWQVWQPRTTATSALFVAPGDGLYEFEVRAVDNRGLVENFTGEPEAATIVDVVAPFVQPQLWFPRIFS
jgi:hypothetical protein